MLEEMNMSNKPKAPGKSFRDGISLTKLFRMFPDDATAEKWFTTQRWGNEPTCPHCGSTNVQSGAKHKTMPYRCREKECAKRFSVRTGTVMQASNLGYQTWAVAIYLVTTSLKGVSSMKLHRDLEVTQKSAWHLAHRLRKAFEVEVEPFSSTVEVDETFIGGKEKNKHNSKRSHTRGPSGKTVVVGIKDREANKVVAKPVPERTKEELQGFISANVSRKAMVYTDDHRSYIGLPFEHESVNHSVGEYVREQAHTNGVESFWAVLKRGYYGTYHRISPKHLSRYCIEFSGRHNVRELDTIDQMTFLAKGMVGKRLKYKELTS